MLAYKVMGAGVQGLAVQSICLDVNASITASGTSQSTATSLTNALNYVASVSGGTGVVLSSDARGGDSQLIYNGGANPLKVYPPSGARINAVSTNGAVILSTNTACEFHCASLTLWVAVLSA